MIGVFLKELRENFKWAIVIFIVTLLLVYYEMRRADPDFLFRLPNGIPFLPPMAGLLLGVVQSIFETKPDNWAFVVHRPVPRFQIYLAKCAAALLALYVAIGLPLALAVLWATRTGSIAMPFQWRAVLPMIVDTFNGGSFYFAGVVLTLRKARWFGTRLLPFGLALLGTTWIDIYINTFGQAMIVSAILHILGASAAWGVFATAGETDRPGLWRFGLGAMLFGGALPICITVSMAVQLFYSGSIHWQQYQLDRDGNLLHIVWNLDPGGQRSSTITDAADQPLKKYEGLDIDDPENSDQLTRLNNSLFDDDLNQGFVKMLTGGSYRNSQLGVIRLRSVAPPNLRVRTLCLFDMQKRIIDVYDPVTRVLEGTIGPAGFAQGQAPNQPFPGEVLNPYQQGGTRTLAFPLGVWWMELHQRKVRSIFTAAADDPVISAVELPPTSDPTIVIATKKQMHVLRPSGEWVYSIPLPGDPTAHYFQAGILASNHHLAVYVGSLPKDRRDSEHFRSEYLEFGDDGRLVRRTVMPEPPSFAGAKVPETAMFGAVYPLALRAILPNWLLDGMFDLRTEHFRGLFHGFLFTSAALCGIAALFLGWRMGFGVVKMIGWMIACILLGPAGIVVMLGLNNWPAREKCPACNGKRILARRACPHCGATPPLPKLDGREIFEPAIHFYPRFNGKEYLNMMLENCELVAFVATTQSDKARAFYCDILGLRFEEDSPFALVLRTANATLRIQKVQAFTPLQFTALGWKVVNVKATAKQLLDKGVKCERFEGMNQDDLGIWASPSGAMVCWFKDPDGNILSLTQST